MSPSSLSSIEFQLPPELEASEPPEARGLQRDHVRLMVSNYSTDQVWHTRFDQLPEYLSEGDVIVVNTSRTRNSALLASRADSAVIELHLSTHLDENEWTAELRSIDEAGKTKHLEDAREVKF
jgi:S-adenosylmethionine:tRNA ribosyltransferase-isomerase